MRYLANGKQVSFDSIENDILYAVDKGSVVKDYMGYVKAVSYTHLLQVLSNADPGSKRSGREVLSVGFQSHCALLNVLLISQYSG